MTSAAGTSAAVPSGKPTLGDSIASLRVIADAVGWVHALRIGASISTPSASKALFSGLSAATDDREVASREQAGPAILLYRALTEHVGQARALEVTGDVVATGALRFLGRQLQDLDPAAFVAASDAERRASADRWIDAFFTADAALDEVTESTVVFNVSGCALHRLAAATGHPELAPVFCRADAAFFANRTPPIDLHRPTTIASGDDQCRFELSMAQPQADRKP